MPTKSQPAPVATAPAAEPIPRKKRGWTAARRKKQSDIRLAQLAAQGETGGGSKPQPNNLTTHIRNMVASARSLTTEQLRSQVEAYASPDNTIGSQADRHVLQAITREFETVCAPRSMSQGGGTQHA